MVKFQVKFRTALRTVAGQDTVVFLTGFLLTQPLSGALPFVSSAAAVVFVSFLPIDSKNLLFFQSVTGHRFPSLSFPIQEKVFCVSTTSLPQRGHLQMTGRFPCLVCADSIATFFAMISFYGFFREFQNIDTGQGPVLDRVQLLGEIYRYRNIKVDSEFFHRID